MNLSVAQLARLLELLGEETVVAPSLEFPFRISQRAFGYREGLDGVLQAALSVALQAAKQREQPS